MFFYPYHAPAAIIAPLSLVKDPRGVREALLRQYRFDLTSLIQLTLEHWHDFTDEVVDLDTQTMQQDLIGLTLETHLRKRRLRYDYAHLRQMQALCQDAMRQIQESWEPLVGPYLRHRGLPSRLRLERFIGHPGAALIEVRFSVPSLALPHEV